MVNKIFNEPCLETIKRFDDNSIDCVITSPPYWQLRDYGYNGQWGLEPTFQMYLGHLWEMMDAIMPKLKSTGTVWINLGDTYGTQSGNMRNPVPSKESDYAGNGIKVQQPKSIPKCLLLLPHRFAIGCIDRGWIIRNDIIWAKRNGMPESVIDRFSKKHEYFFFMTKSPDYYFDLDAIKDRTKTIDNNVRDRETTKLNNTPGRTKMGGLKENNYSSKNPGTVSDFWDIPTKPSSEEHYASYNDEMLKKPIIAGCPKYVCSKCGKPREKIIQNTPMVIKRSGRRELMGQPNGTASSGTMVSPAINKVAGPTDCGCAVEFIPGVVYDPFMGTGTTAKMCIRTGRSFVGSEMSEKYFKDSTKIINRLLTQTQLF